MFNYFSRHCTLTVSLFLLTTTAAFGASVSSRSLGTGNYVIEGNLDGVATIDMVISYDTSMSSPTVTSGGLIAGALMVPNVNTAGTIRIGIITTKPFTGSGQIALIKFAQGDGKLSITSTKITDVNANPKTVRTSVEATNQIKEAANQGSNPIVPVAPAVPVAAPTSAPATETPAQAGSTIPSATPAYLGTVTMPSETPAASEKTTAAVVTEAPAEKAAPVEAAAPTVPPAVSEPADQQPLKAPAEPQKNEELKLINNGSVLERFRAYQGEKSPAILMVLFKKQVSAAIRQIPVVAISDGTTVVKLVTELTGSDQSSPNFAFSDAKLISLSKEPDSDKWTIELLPLKGTTKAHLTILNGNTIIEYPLTVATPIPNFSASEADFAKFIQNSRDLNNDGRRDYIDEFIYTANFLSQKTARAVDPAKKKHD